MKGLINTHKIHSGALKKKKKKPTQIKNHQGHCTLGGSQKGSNLSEGKTSAT